MKLASPWLASVVALTEQQQQGGGNLDFFPPSWRGAIFDIIGYLKFKLKYVIQLCWKQKIVQIYPFLKISNDCIILNLRDLVFTNEFSLSFDTDHSFFQFLKFKHLLEIQSQNYLKLSIPNRLSRVKLVISSKGFDFNKIQ